MQMMSRSAELKVMTIVPRLPLLIDGVGDYALQLAQVLRCQHQIETEFIVCDPCWQGTVPFPVQVLTADSATELFDRLCRSSDVALTNCAAYAIELVQLSGGRHSHIPVLPNLLSKSGFFAAYCAHGLVPIVTSPIPLAPDFGEDEVPPYLHINAPHQVDGRFSDPALQLLADRANYWYQSHSLDRQAQVLSQMLQELAVAELMVVCRTV
jgi:hypothetical protein